MKKAIWLFCLPLILMSGDLKDSLIKAKRANQPMMIYVKSQLCQYCDKMKDNTLNDIKVLNNTKDFMFIVADKDDAETKKYLPDTRYTPTVYFISPKFELVNTVKGYLGKDDFNLWVDDSKAKLGMGSSPETITETTFIAEENDVWMYDMLSAMDYASQTGKQIMIYLYTPNEKWSKKMSKSTFTNSYVKDALENFVWVKIEKDSSEAYSLGLRPKYAPTVYFMKADKSLLATAKGYFKADDFILWINHAKSKI